MKRIQTNDDLQQADFQGSKAQEEAARSALVAQHAPLVKLLANRMAMRLPPSVSVDDLISAGSVGLLDAIDKYDPGRDAQLKTYAEFRIKGAILDELRSMDRLPRSARKMARQMEQATMAVEQKLSRPAHSSEIAAEMSVDMDAYYRMLDQARDVEVLSLDDCVERYHNDSGSKRSFESLISGDDNPFDRVATQELKKVMTDEIKALPEKEQMVISLYHYEGLTLREIGGVIGLTESRVSQIHTKAITKLRSRFASYLEA
ncbi:MAG: FliA/WhiG family RNA polymerase sigma factor [Deltaproteobacteria bacterium]|nr:FliA/WhiG family RNA polymerase sigma factor [Deltaproteobacteria bacterium]